MSGVILLLMEVGAQLAGQTPQASQAPAPLPIPQSSFASAAPYFVQAAPAVAAPPAVQGPLPDPTNPSDPFKKMLQPKTTGPTAASRLPTFVIRGRVLAAGKEPTAMLEVDGKLALVQPGSVLAFGGSTIRVTEITSQEVRLEIGSSGEKLSLR
jgi:hypothetical protein